MQWIEAIILGLLQGLTEFIPVSSSAHIRVVGELLPGAADPGAAFTAITQIGTEVAVLVYFWRDILRILRAWAAAVSGRLPHNDPDARMGWLIIVGTIPIVVLGLFFEDAIDTVFRSLWLVATMFVVFGVVLAAVDVYGRRTKALEELSIRDGLIYGFAQALALIPGVSRAGGTISAGLALGYTREAAARYSFLLAIPAVFGSGFYKLFQALGEEQTGPFTMGQTLLATAVGFAVGYVIIGWFLRYVSTNSYTLFVNYRILVGLAIYLLLGFGIISA